MKKINKIIRSISKRAIFNNGTPLNEIILFVNKRDYEDIKDSIHLFREVRVKKYQRGWYYNTPLQQYFDDILKENFISNFKNIDSTMGMMTFKSK